MENRIGVVGIVIEDVTQSAESVNHILSGYANIIVGRMGIPYHKRGVSVISLVVDGLCDDIGAMCGKIGRISGVSVKSVLTTKKYEV